VWGCYVYAWCMQKSEDGIWIPWNWIYRQFAKAFSPAPKDLPSLRLTCEFPQMRTCTTCFSKLGLFHLAWSLSSSTVTTGQYLVCVCVCVCVFYRPYICIYMCIYGCMCVHVWYRHCIHVCAYTCMYMYISLCVCVCV